jgi:ABC-type lipoprotein export system ATPase subunit
LHESSSLSIRGDSGCGKSTLLNLLARLEPADEGTIFWGEQRIIAASKPLAVEASWRAKHLGVVYQSYYLIPELTVLENVLMSVRLSGLSIAEYEPRATELLHQMGVASKSKQIPSKLSGGERQRVAIARALVNQPKVILADEPTGNLDERTGAEIMNLLLNASAKEKTSLILVTHNPSFAQATDETSILKDGKLIYE